VDMDTTAQSRGRGPRMPTTQAQFTVTVPGRKLKRLTELAKQDGRSRSNYVERILDRHLREVEAKAA